jgi:hypothetical protein
MNYLIKIPSNGYHVIYTISDEPSCFFYVHINETEQILSDYYERFATNMMRTFNETLASLRSNEEIEVDLENDEEFLKMKAYNMTLIENSKHFLKMLTHQEEQTENNSNNTDLVDKLKRVFEEKKLNKNAIYKKFVSQFSNKFDEQVLNSGRDKWGLVKSRFLKNVALSYQRFERRSAFYIVNFIELINYF